MSQERIPRPDIKTAIIEGRTDVLSRSGRAGAAKTNEILRLRREEEAETKRLKDLARKEDLIADAELDAASAPYVEKDGEILPPDEPEEPEPEEVEGPEEK